MKYYQCRLLELLYEYRAFELALYESAVCFGTHTSIMHQDIELLVPRSNPEEGVHFSILLFTPGGEAPCMCSYLDHATERGESYRVGLQRIGGLLTRCMKWHCFFGVDTSSTNSPYTDGIGETTVVPGR